MNFSVGLQIDNSGFLKKIIENRDRINDVYFSWGDFPSGRGAAVQSQQLTSWELQSKMLEALGELGENGIAFNLLFNGNCYGAESQSRDFFNRVGNTVDFLSERFSLKSVTTSSLLIAKFIKANFPSIFVRASVNMEIGTVQGMKYISDYFDGFYLKREFNRDVARIREMKAWCDQSGKKLFLLANSGCLNFCSARTFHDNLVSHENEISKMDNAYDFHGVCRDYLKNEENYCDLYDNMNFVRPEELESYEPYFESVKLATRVHPDPSFVLETYLRGRYSGDLLRLLEPCHSIYPYVLENSDKVKVKKLDLGKEEEYVKQ